MIWTLISFGITFFVLKRYAFGPIQKLIDDRRERIRESVEEADRAEFDKSPAGLALRKVLTFRVLPRQSFLFSESGDACFDRRRRQRRRANRVACNAASDRLDRHGAGKAQQRCLRRDIVDAVDGGLGRVNRRHVDDPAEVALPHGRQSHSDDMERRGQIDSQRAIPIQ